MTKVGEQLAVSRDVKYFRVKQEQVSEVVKLKQRSQFVVYNKPNSKKQLV